MKAVILIGALDILRPLTLSLPQPLIEFCNKTLLLHQLEALKTAGVHDVILCVNEKNLPKTWDQVIAQYEAELGMRIQCSMETTQLGTAGPLQLAQDLITNQGSSTEPFFVLNGDVLCSFPLKDMIHVHVKHAGVGGVGTIMTTRNAKPSCYGVVVADEKTGKVEHFVNRPECVAGLNRCRPSAAAGAGVSEAVVWAGVCLDVGGAGAPLAAMRDAV
jgi:mannose-1-phosphate guanylyltransferase